MVKEYGYEYNATTNGDILSVAGWSGTDKKLWDAYSLRSGRDALKVIAREYPNSTVFLPSLCCDSMITPFEMYGCEIVFYPLTTELGVDFSALLSKLQLIKEQKLLLFYDYFAIKMFHSNQLVELKRAFNDLILIEDITHTLLNFKGTTPYVDYTIASLRKWVNLPDGGLLWTKHKLNNLFLSDDSKFAEQRLRAQCMRTEYFDIGDESIKTAYRKIFCDVSALLDSDPSSAKMTEYSYELAHNTDWEDIKRKRRANADILSMIFSGNQNIRIINCGISRSDLYVPIIIQDRDEVQRNLSSKGIFNTIIWPLRKEQMLVCSTAKYVAEHMLAVPCDQRYAKEDMLYIGSEITRAING
ncbi:MAG: hypothetical protein IKA46_01435 [Clostridia bacterium]|nr:hypothetical protein [Clostridia bacterium]